MSIFAQDLDPGLRPGSVASRCWTVFSLRVRRTRIADIASDTPLIWGSPRGDDDRNGPARQSLSSFVSLDRTRSQTQTLKLLIYGLSQKGRVLAQDGVGQIVVSTQQPLYVAANVGTGRVAMHPVNRDVPLNNSFMALVESDLQSIHEPLLPATVIRVSPAPDGNCRDRPRGSR